MDAVFPRAFANRQDIEIEETIRKERPRLLNFIRTRVRTEDDAQDILQEVLGQFVETYRGLETIDRVGSWLFRVARNKITDAYRRRKPEAQLQMLGEREHLSEMGLEDVVPTPTEDPEALYMRETIWHAIEAALEELQLTASVPGCSGLHATRSRTRIGGESPRLSYRCWESASTYRKWGLKTWFRPPPRTPRRST